MKNSRTKKYLLIQGMAIFYVLAGINHFYNPEFYLPLIPPFFSKGELINVLAGIAEILLGLGIGFRSTRVRAAWGVLILLLLFIPSHIYFIQMGSCIQEGLCVPKWIGWVRLLIIHPLLIFWAYWITRNSKING
jgi:uncharacterized membrane protein